MKKKLIVAALVLGLFTAVSSLACTAGDCGGTPAPAVKQMTGGQFFVDVSGKSGAWADGKNTYTKAMTGGQFEYNAVTGSPTNGLKIQSVGGFLGEAEGPKSANTGGYAKGFGSWGTQQFGGWKNH